MAKKDFIIKKDNDGSVITVRDVQEVLLNMLIDIDKICRDNHIDYILEGGTALGAVRHGGFIPWDDDLDIAMMRDDYNRFVKVLEKSLPDEYVFHCFEKNKKYNVTIPAMKIRKKNTYIKEKNNLLPNKCKDSDGLFIDIFILDHVSKCKVVDVLFRIVNTILMFIINIFENIKINPIPLKYLYIGIAKFYGWINKRSKYIGLDLTWTFINPFKAQIFKYSDVYPVKDIKFENRKFLMANNPNEFLKTDIGVDFMTLPPEEKRVPKHTADVNLYGPNSQK